jgi:signal peptidase II
MTYLIVFLIIFLDQWIKILVKNSFYPGKSIPIIKNVFHLTYVKNTGAAFGILKDHSNFFIIISVLIIMSIIAFKFYFDNKNRWFNGGLALITGGAIGNLIDRFRLGFVIDYLDFRIWPVFNLADSAVVIGSFLLIMYYWNSEKNGWQKNE